MPNVRLLWSAAYYLGGLGREGQVRSGRRQVPSKAGSRYLEKKREKVGKRCDSCKANVER